jgi:hypothetical protein
MNSAASNPGHSFLETSRTVLALQYDVGLNGWSARILNISIDPIGNTTIGEEILAASAILIVAIRGPIFL